MTRGWFRLVQRVKKKKTVFAKRKAGIEFGIPAKNVFEKSVSQNWRPHPFFNLAFMFENLGVGMRFTRKHWHYAEPCYWTVTRVVPKLNHPRVKRGKAWGILTWRGKTDPKEQKIRCPNKRGWRFIPKDAEINSWWDQWMERLRPQTKFLPSGKVVPLVSKSELPEEGKEQDTEKAEA